MTSDADWIKALSFAALPGAARVVFSRTHGVEDGTPTTRYTLRSYDGEGNVIGDDRDYDLLKAAMGPLERLSDPITHEFEMTLDCASGTLDRRD